ncbi:related to pleiotropic drug resistance control protein PDR6 [Cephalotrichum gorgonifer]|uniref:Related to pleiotropic drug resistance control protein PDR6 n=1 Tax=Cephalotrichum gorgonifer TaxID=2041049 RepID=A0AAE8SYK8_9PEZI|nr:related to pleiotropic drug resistance control protein PDR6 [Cephalotrichum gorgonifer]
MAQLVPHQAKDKRRVKVYELRNNDWFDRGTGFCTAAFLPSEDGQCRDARVTVESEDEPDRLLLDTSIYTLIVWTEPSSGLDMALSFQEGEGCAMIWCVEIPPTRHLEDASYWLLRYHMGRTDFLADRIGNLSTVFNNDSLSDDLTMDMTTTISLPPAELGNLAEIETVIRQVSNTGAGRDALAKYILKEDYMRKLVPLVDTSEDFESLVDLHRLCNIVKMVILLNDPALIEHMVTDDCINGVVGALEYDPDFPRHKANHRQWLNGEGRFREVVPFEDDHIRQKIHQTYRLQYLKDVVLARILDDPTFSVLNSLIFFNQVDIVQHVRDNSAFLSDLFGIFKSPSNDHKHKKDAVLFIQQCCAIAKNLQIPARQTLYNNFIAHGLLQVINFGLRHPDVGVRVGATDILVSLIDHDPQMIRATIYRQLNDGQPPLTDSLIDLLLVEVDLGVKSQISDALKVLLDGLQITQVQDSAGRAPGEFATGRRVVEHNPQQELFLARFYETSALRLFKPLLDLEGKTQLSFTTQQASMFSYLIEILCFFIRQHYHRSKGFVLQRNISQRIAQLLQSEEKYLRLVAIRFFRQLLGLQDVFYIKHLIDKDIFGPILDILISTMPRDNLLGSACLEFFEFIKKESMRDLVKHLVHNYRDQFVALSDLDTFRGMILRYDQTQGFTLGTDFLLDSEEDVTRRPTGHTRMMEQLHVDPAEEEYWNASDDEDEQPAAVSDKMPSSGRASPAMRQLVDYLSDGDDDDEADGEEAAAEVPKTEKPVAKAEGDMKTDDVAASSESPDAESGEEKPPGTSQVDGASDAGSVTSEAVSDSVSVSVSVSTPRRLSEKRRREEDDDDDELGKMMQNKRRNSKSMAANAAATTQSLLKRKSSFTGGNGAANPKIAISISSTGAGLRSNEES